MLRPYPQLFLSFVVLAFLYPVLRLGSVGVWVWSASFWLSLLLATRACAKRRIEKLVARWLFVALLVVGVVMNALRDVEDPRSPLAVHVAMVTLNLAFFGWTGRVLFRDVMLGRRVTTDKIFGAVCFYILIGLAGAYVYVLIGLLGTEPVFAVGGELADQGVALLQDHSGEALQTCLYFSFVSLSTLGYGDIIPVADFARVFSSAEALLGQLYLTILVARLVGLHISQRGQIEAD